MMVSTGSSVLDKLLSGGLETDVLTTVYGPAGSGKSNICMLAGITVAKSGKKVVYVDTEGSFSLARFNQIVSDGQLDGKALIDNFVFLKPTNFTEQRDAFNQLRRVNFENVGLIVVDSIAMLYRLEMGKTNEVYDVNKELGQQIGFLTEIARKKNIPVLLTNQVYANFEDKSRINMVGGDILKYGSKCLIELQSLRSMRKAVLKKHRSLPDGREAMFVIRNEGIFEAGAAVAEKAKPIVNNT